MVRKSTFVASFAAAATIAALAAAGASAAPFERVELGHEADQVVVGFRAGVTQAEQRTALRAYAGRAGQALALARTRLLTLPEGVSVRQAVRALERDPDVLFAEPNYVYRLNAVPNDPRFGELWGLHQANDHDIDAVEAWNLTTGDPAVVVAVIDSGVAYDHPDLAPNVWANPGEIAGNALDDDGNGFIDDIRGWDFVQNDNTPLDPNGHGTHVAGTIGARGNNAVGVTGVNWQVSLMPIRAGNALGSLTNAAVTNAIVYACGEGADVVNGSFGGPSQSIATTNAMKSTACAGTLFVFAAGNDGRNNDSRPSFPCSSPVPTIVCVAATNRNDVKAGFSNFGRKNVDIAAPGVSILSGAPSFDAVAVDGFENVPSAFTARWGGQSSPAGHPLWGQSGIALSGSFGMSDSPVGNYANNTDARIRSLVPVDLSVRTGCLLDFALRLNTEFDFDFFEMSAGTSFGGTYNGLAAYTGSTGGQFFALTEDLAAFEGQSTVHLRARLLSDGSIARAGADLDELVVSCLGSPPASGEYASFDGTSMAAPHVAGVAALMLAANPALTPLQLRTKLLRTTDPLIGLALKVRTGGRVNAARAIASAVGSVPFVRCVVPRVIGKSLQKAKGALVGAGCRTGTIRRVRSTAPPGRITKQSWPVGVWLPKGTRVGLSVSRGR